MNTKIEIYKKSNYGLECFYIKDPDIASCINMLTGQKTLTTKTMKALKDLGFELVEVIAPGVNNGR